MLSDNSMTVSLLLVNCYLDDKRKGREGKLNRLIERAVNDVDVAGDKEESIDSLPTRRSMIDVTFQQTRNSMFGEYNLLQKGNGII